MPLTSVVFCTIVLLPRDCATAATSLDEIFPETRRQRCWVHKTANVLNYLPKSLQARAEAGLHDI